MNNLKKTLTVRLAQGIGNQLFMYANAYSLSKSYNYQLFIDNTSGYFKKKDQLRTYELNNFLLEENLATSDLKFDTHSKNLKRKILIKLDKFRKHRSFILEKKDANKKTFFTKINLDNYSNKLFLEGHFESEKYFYEYKDDLKKIFKVKNNLLENNNLYMDDIKNNNSVSICIRQNRYSEGRLKNNDKSLKFTKDTIDYIHRAITYIKKKIDNPMFFVWSNDFKNLREHFNEREYVFVENSINKSLNDFHLFNFSKHFIVGPTSFHWWGAWLNNNPNKICLRPKNINPSNNNDFWPNEWISI
tara:strand:+ start:1250 stop:2155 length:906 start_codon:yes stop_codon:yes gene_type:complete